MLLDEMYDGPFQRGCGQTPTGEVLVATVLDEAPGDVVPEPFGTAAGLRTSLHLYP